MLCEVNTAFRIWQIRPLPTVAVWEVSKTQKLIGSILGRLFCDDLRKKGPLKSPSLKDRIWLTKVVYSHQPWDTQLGTEWVDSSLAHPRRPKHQVQWSAMSWLLCKMVCKSFEAAEKWQPEKHQVTVYKDTTQGRVALLLFGMEGRMLPICQALSCSSTVLITGQYGSENAESQKGKTSLRIRKQLKVRWRYPEPCRGELAW